MRSSAFFRSRTVTGVAVLGAILGAALGFPAIPERWIRGLRSCAELGEAIETFIARFA